MPEQHIIMGTLTPAEEAERTGVRVLMFDRDLPSLERGLGSAPQMLGGGNCRCRRTLSNHLHTRAVPERRRDFYVSQSAREERRPQLPRLR
jgi:hypothetical protein